MRAPLLLPAFALLALAGCDGSDPAPRDCVQYDTCQAEQPLRITPLSLSADEPANVEVFFQVQTAERQPLSGLRVDQFTIFEDGEPISRFEATAQIQPRSERFQSSTALLLDFSASVTQSGNLEPLKSAAVQFAQTLLPDASDPNAGQAEVGVFWFDGQADIQPLVPFTSNRAAVVAGIQAVTPGISVDNSTNLYGAVVQGVAAVRGQLEGADDGVLAVGSLVTFTDGTDTAGRRPRTDAVRSVDTASGLQEDGLDLFTAFTIGLGGEVDQSVLQDLGPALAVRADNTADLSARFREIARRLEAAANSFYLLEYCSPKRSGRHTLGIRVEADLAAPSGTGTVTAAGVLEQPFDADGFRGGCVVD